MKEILILTYSIAIWPLILSGFIFTLCMIYDVARKIGEILESCHNYFLDILSGSLPFLSFMTTLILWALVTVVAVRPIHSESISSLQGAVAIYFDIIGGSGFAGLISFIMLDIIGLILCYTIYRYIIKPIKQKMEKLERIEEKTKKQTNLLNLYDCIYQSYPPLLFAIAIMIGLPISLLLIL